MLGSPLPGWTTWFMGFNLEAGGLAGTPRRRCPSSPSVSSAATTSSSRSLSRPATPRGLGFERTRGGAWSWICGRRRRRSGADEGIVRTAIRKAEQRGDDRGGARPRLRRRPPRPARGRVREAIELAPPGPERIRDLIRPSSRPGDRCCSALREPRGRLHRDRDLPGVSRIMHFLAGGELARPTESPPNEALMWYAMRYWRDARGAGHATWAGTWTTSASGVATRSRCSVPEEIAQRRRRPPPQRGEGRVRGAPAPPAAARAAESGAAIRLTPSA